MAMMIGLLFLIIFLLHYYITGVARCNFVMVLVTLWSFYCDVSIYPTCRIYGRRAFSSKWYAVLGMVFVASRRSTRGGMIFLNLLLLAKCEQIPVAGGVARRFCYLLQITL